MEDESTGSPGREESLRTPEPPPDNAYFHHREDGRDDDEEEEDEAGSLKSEGTKNGLGNSGRPEALPPPPLPPPPSRSRRRKILSLLVNRLNIPEESLISESVVDLRVLFHCKPELRVSSSPLFSSLGTHPSYQAFTPRRRRRRDSPRGSSESSSRVEKNEEKKEEEDEKKSKNLYSIKASYVKLEPVDPLVLDKITHKGRSTQPVVKKESSPNELVGNLSSNSFSGSSSEDENSRESKKMVLNPLFTIETARSKRKPIISSSEDEDDFRPSEFIEEEKVSKPIKLLEDDEIVKPKKLSGVEEIARPRKIIDSSDEDNHEKSQIASTVRPTVPKKKSGYKFSTSIFDLSKEFGIFKTYLKIHNSPTNYDILNGAKCEFSDLESLVTRTIKNLESLRNGNYGNMRCRATDSPPRISSKYKDRFRLRSCGVQLEDLSSLKKEENLFTKALEAFCSNRKRFLTKSLDRLKRRSRDHEYSEWKRSNTDKNSSDHSRPLSSNKFDKIKKKRPVEETSNSLALDTSYADDLSQLGRFKIPRKDKSEVDMKAILREGLSKSTPQSMPNKKVSSYKQQYRRHSNLTKKNKKLFNPEAFVEDPSKTLDVMNIVQDMSSTLPKKKSKPDTKDREKEKKNQDQDLTEKCNSSGANGENSENVELTTGSLNVNDLLDTRVDNGKGKTFYVFSSYNRPGTSSFSHYKCFICNVRSNRKSELLAHASSSRHNRNMKSFTVENYSQDKSHPDKKDSLSTPVSPCGSFGSFVGGDDFAPSPVSDYNDTKPLTDIGLSLPQPVPTKEKCDVFEGLSLSVTPVPATSDLLLAKPKMVSPPLPLSKPLSLDNFQMDLALEKNSCSDKSESQKLLIDEEIKVKEGKKCASPSNSSTSSQSGIGGSGLKLKPLNLLRDSTDKFSPLELKGAGLSIFLDKVINSLKSWSKKDVLSHSYSSEKPPLPVEPPPPLPDEPPPPPPPPPPPEDGKINVIEGDIDDELVNQIVSELDQSLTQEKNLAKAKEKLASILNARRFLSAKPMNVKPVQTPPSSSRSTNITDSEINNFMTKWCNPRSEEDKAEPALSSALAKLRAKRKRSVSKPLISIKKEIDFDSSSQSPKKQILDSDLQPEFIWNTTLESSSAANIDIEKLSAAVDNIKRITESQKYSIQSLKAWHDVMSKGWEKRMEEHQEEMKFIRGDNLGDYYHDYRLNVTISREYSNERVPVFRTWEEENTTFFSCEVCQIRVRGFESLRKHIDGESHGIHLTMYKTEEPVPPGEEAPLPIVPVILKMLDEYSEAPLIGLEYIVEILRGGSNEPTYVCLLCDTKFDAIGAMSELLSINHRLNYLKRHFPLCWRKFDKVTNQSFWEKPTYDFLESVIEKIEKKYGRLRPRLVNSEDSYLKNEDQLRSEVQDGLHYTECVQLDFSNLPDPFGSYIYKIPENEIDKDAFSNSLQNEGLDRDEDSEVHRDIPSFSSSSRFRNERAGEENKLSSERGDRKNSTGDGLDIISDNDMPEILEQKLARNKYTRSPSPRREGRSKKKNRNNFRNRYSRGRRGRRSRSMSPKRRRMMKRSRESPFSKELERYEKFKAAKRVMLDAVERKKEIFDKRPEDHPEYPEEWRLFWERRYKELLAQGKDADSHDYKAEWIPFWTRRAKEIFDLEIEEKTRGLLDKFNLKNDFKPVRRAEDRMEKQDFFPEHAMRDERRDFQPRREERRSRDSYTSNSREDRYPLNPREDRYPPDSREDRYPPDSREERYHTDSREDRYPPDSREDRYPSDSREDRYPPDSREDRYPTNSHEDRFSSERYKKSPQRGLFENQDRRDFDSESDITSRRKPISITETLKMTDPHSLKDEYQYEVGNPDIISSVRALVAVEDVLGSLGSQINALLGRALSMDKKRKGLCKLLMEDADVAAIMEMAYEKLSAQLEADLLEFRMIEPARKCAANVKNLLRHMTHKRPDGTPMIYVEEELDEQTKVMELISDQLSKTLIQQGLDDLNSHGLLNILNAVIKNTELDCGVPYELPPELLRPPTPDPVPYKSVSQSYSGNDDVVIDDSTLEDFEDLTMEELRALLDNFKNLSKGEQMDLIQYMRKLESSNPDKVLLLRSSIKPPERERAGTHSNLGSFISQTDREGGRGSYQSFMGSRY